ncbi:hypothetical protein J2S43_007906 [Catenuloplanes nepalensis]|uniref:Uncharacterized protein n=1 Tax=Catenuloplanes nepalensis TaxID=587533 RepID=A0ABT9N6S2_9ACTN|nr:hypothetical protein [Catenuloplanes nepalensis]
MQGAVISLSVGAHIASPGPNGLSCPIGVGNMPAQTSIEAPGTR